MPTPQSRPVTCPPGQGLTRARPGRRLSPHFNEGEFRCRCCGVVRLNIRLINMLEQLRAHLGHRPVVITSGYRCPGHNRSQGHPAFSGWFQSFPTVIIELTGGKSRSFLYLGEPFELVIPVYKIRPKKTSPKNGE